MNTQVPVHVTLALLLPSEHQLLAPFRELPVDNAIAEHWGRIRRETGTRIADALIAATAVEYELVLFTRNIRHFERVRGLSLYEFP